MSEIKEIGQTISIIVLAIGYICMWHGALTSGKYAIEMQNGKQQLQE